MRKRRRADIDDSGQDSFLDIVANLVGILVILVMVIGVRAQDAWVESTDEDLPEPDKKAIKIVSELQGHASNLNANIHEIEDQTARLGTIVNQRQRERHQLKVLLTAARHELDDRRDMLDAESQRQIELSNDARALTNALAEVQDHLNSLATENEEVIELEHLPTPLAKTVFGREQHFQLKDGYLAHVPLNLLTERLKAEAPKKIWKLKQSPQITETIGPFQGFHMRYTMHRRQYASVTKAGPVVRQLAELKEFVLVPLSDDLGERVETALQPNSQFTQLIESFHPNRTVITIWTYPDSFESFRNVKRWLFDRGFACAARPLPHGQPISGSPRGSRSAAQ